MTLVPKISLARACEIAKQAALKGAQQPGAPDYLTRVHDETWEPHDWVVQAVLDAYADGVAAASVAQSIDRQADAEETAVEKPVALNIDQPMARLPRMYDAWKHKKSGRIYFVNMLANDHTSDPEKFPAMVVYTHVPTEQTWARPLAAFHEKFEFVGVKPAEPFEKGHTLAKRLKELEEQSLDAAAENLVGATKLECKLALKSMIEEQSRQMKPLIMALTKIWQWHGEFPEEVDAEGKPITFWRKHGTAGERDYMRRIAGTAIKKGHQPLPDAPPMLDTPPFQ